MRVTVTTNRLKYYMEILSITTFITCTTIQQYNTFLITYIISWNTQPDTAQI